MEPYPILLVTLFGLCSSQTLNSDGVPVFSDCGGDITVNKGIITSPGYPGDYANNLMCRWRILTRVKNIQVRILLTDLNIWESENCESDFLRIVIHGGEARSYRLCGDKKGQSRNTTGHAPIDIVMQTDKENVTRGFKINFEVLSPCLSEPCQNGGTCDYDADSYNCSCTSGWEGTNCELETDECASNPCVNGGTCTDAFDHFTCACSPGVTGATCDVIEDSCVHLAPCENGATCRPTNGSYSCLCVNGYTGRNCVEEIDECDPNPCQNGGICEDAFASFTCTCVDGYTGDNCQVAPTTTTKPTTTTATTTVTTTTIATTTTRATTTATRRSSATTSKFCSQQSALLCMNGGSCVVVDNSRESCLCQEGFSGPTCQTVDKNSPDYLHALIATSVGSFVCILLMLALLCLVLCKKKRAKRCENISNGRRGDGASDHVTKPEDLQPTKQAWGERHQAAIDSDFTSPKGAVGSATYDIVRSPDLVTSPMYSARYNPAGYFYENPNAMVQPYNCQSMQVGSKRRHSTTNSFMHSNRDQLFSVGDVINAVEPNKEDYNDTTYHGHKNDNDSRHPHHIKGHKPVKNRHKSTKDNSDVKIPPHTAAALINYLSTALGRDRQHQGRKKTPEKPPSETNVLKDIDSDGLTNEIASPRRADVQINQSNDRTRQRRTKWRSPGKDNCDSLELDNLKLYDYFDQFASDRKGRAVLRLTRENAFLFE